MATFIIPAATGGISLEEFIEPRGSTIASKLLNFIPTATSIELRKGFTSYFDLGEVKAKNIVSYEARNALIVVTEDKLYGLRNNELTALPYDKSLGEVINSIQTNDRVILFFINREPLVIYHGATDNVWKVEELDLKIKDGGSVGVFLSGAVKYKERLFFYTEGFNTIYYLEPLMYKGEVKEYELEGRFGAKGKLTFLGTIGFNAGASVQSLMYAVFDSGDILTFSGINPDNLGDWIVEQKVETGAILSTSVNVLTDSFLIGGDGLYSLTSILRDNNIAGSDTLSNKIKSRIREMQSEGILTGCFLNGYLYLINLGNANHFGVNMNTGAIFEIDNYEIYNFAVLNNELLFCDSKGLVFKAFNGVSDNGEDIVGTWESFPLTTQDYTKFRTLTTTIDSYINGNYILNFSQKVDDSLNMLKRGSIKINNGELLWLDIQGKLWEWIENSLWSNIGSAKRQIFTISTGSVSKRYSFRIEVKSNLHNQFNFNKLAINYVELGR